jgi:hypothetical protein
MPVTNKPPQNTGVYVPTCIWTNIEVHIGIVTASIPAFWPLLRALATGSVRAVTQSRTGPSHVMSAPPMTGTPPSFLSRGRRGASSQSRPAHDDEEGFVYLKDITGSSPVPSRQGDLERASSEERGGAGLKSGPVVVEKAVLGAGKQGRSWREERMARIQVRSDWTVSTESNVGRERQERSFLK